MPNNVSLCSLSWLSHTCKLNVHILLAGICARRLELMDDPVIAADGHSYERSSIEDWFRHHKTSPKTNEKLESKHLTPNHTLKSLISDFKELHPAEVWA